MAASRIAAGRLNGDGSRDALFGEVGEDSLLAGPHRDTFDGGLDQDAWWRVQRSCGANGEWIGHCQARESCLRSKKPPLNPQRVEFER